MTRGIERSLFAGRPGRPRLVWLSRAVFPLADEASWYAQLDELAADLGAELRAVHTVVPDPRPLAAPLRARLGSGLFVPQNPHLHRNDVAHCQRTLGARCERLLAALERVTGLSPAELLHRPELHEAFSYARWIRAWGADLVWSHGLTEGSLPALVTAHLLELPRVVVLDAATFDSAYAQLLPLHVEQAQLVVAIGAHVHDALLARCGASAAAKTVLVLPDAIASPTVRAAVARALAMPRPASAPSRGPDAAFVAPRRRSSPPRAARPFVVLGAERTGSNMLVSMLQVRVDVACAGELFNPRLIAEHNLEWLPHRSASTEELLRLRQADPAALLDRLWADGAAGGATLVGFKLLYGHGVIDDRILDALQAEPDLVVIHLLRADRLQRWLSLARSLATDEWFAAAGAPAAAQSAPIELAPQATATEFALGELFEARYRATFAAHRSLELDYEDLAQHLPASAQRLGAFLGCDLGVMTPRSRKTGSRDLARSIANLGELRAAFVDTRWAGLFD